MESTNLQESSNILYLTGTSEIYSQDPIFNEQIQEKKILIKNAKILHKKDNKSFLVISNISDKTVSKFDKTSKFVDHKKQKQKLKEIINKIKENQEKTDFSLIDQIKSNPSSNHFLHIHTRTKDYISPSYSNYDLSKIYIVNNYSIKKALDQLYTQKYFYYNNKALAFCFSRVFCVRPPPLLS